MKPFFSVSELAVKTNQSKANIRRLIKKYNEVNDRNPIFKVYNEWFIPSSVWKEFLPKNIKKNKLFALSVDCYNDYSEDDMHKILQYVVSETKDIVSEIHYVIQQKHGKDNNGRNHFHFFMKCSNRKKFKSIFKENFGDIHFYATPIYELQGWQNYIQRFGETLHRIP